MIQIMQVQVLSPIKKNFFIKSHLIEYGFPPPPPFSKNKFNKGYIVDGSTFGLQILNLGFNSPISLFYINNINIIIIFFLLLFIRNCFLF